MNIYNYIYCFFYKFWEKRGNDGRIVGSAHVVFSVIMHFFLITEIIQGATGIKIIKLSAFGQHGGNKSIYFLFFVIVWLGFWVFYNRERTKRLQKVYYQKYNEGGIKNTIKILLYVVVPMVLLITLVVIRQNKG